ncbi:DNA cytosine methyltransferase [Hymenobacter psoromatis]|uniref:DNA cytosine methyltransferase n=1 Tax=Hymenobacter psoromatis TaxID=1484116 RepID=UPI001CBF93B9|nr:DNA cytosine methyltransferase [Hymenobacter psoromatis]
MQAVSLFSNCGAGDVGYRRAGFGFKIMAELERQRLEVCKLNHPRAIGIAGDLRKTWRDVVMDWFFRRTRTERPDLLCACPPCQGMSSARSGMGRGDNPEHGARDQRNLLVEVVADVIQCLRPRMVVLENVPQFLTKLVPHPETGRGISAPRLLLERIGAEYYFFPVIVDLADYGVPQTRKRCFITLIRRGEPALDALIAQGLTPFPALTHAGNRVSFGQHFQEHPLPPLDPRWDHTATTPGDRLHSVGRWAEDDRRYLMTAATAPNGGSAWDNTQCESNCDNSQQVIGPNDHACPQCGQPLLRPIVREKDGTVRLINGFRSSSYRRMSEHAVASTVTTASGHLGSDINIHPTEHRLLSVRECARLQTFPDDFKWGEVLAKGALGKIRQMIGEAVPPRFTELHGNVLRHLLRGEIPPVAEMMPANHRCHQRGVTKFGVTQQLQLALATPPADDCTA